MRKIISILLVVLMLSALCVSAFADTDPIISPTAPKEFIVEFDDYGTGKVTVTTDDVPEGDTVRYEADPDSPYEFIGFEIEGDYEIVEGSLTGPYIVIRPLSDLVVIAKYDTVPVTTNPADTGNNGPQTGFSPLWITVAFAALIACAIAVIFVVKRMAKREG